MCYNFCHVLRIRLFFYIQIWRASSINYNKWSLSESIEEKLRRIVYEGCLNFDNELNLELQKEIVSFPLILNFLETPKDRNTSNWIFITKEKFPYIFFFCDFILEFFITNDVKSDLSKVSNFSNLNDNLTQDEINYCEEKFLIRFLKDDKRNKVVYSSITSELVNVELERVRSIFILSYIKKNRKLPSANVYYGYMSELFFDIDKKLLMSRLSDEQILNAVKKYL